MEDIKTYLERAVQEDAADIFLIAGKPISMKRGGEIRTITDERLMPEDSGKLVHEIYALAHRELPETVTAWDDDFSVSVPGLARFRVNWRRSSAS